MSNQYPVNKSYGDKRGCNHCNGVGYDKNYPHVDCESKKVIFKCRETCGTSISATTTGAETITTNAYAVGRITVRDLCCFKNPCVKLDISSIITGNSTDDALVSLNYQISKRCEDDKEFRPIKDITTLSLPIGTTPGTVPQSISICDCQDICMRSGCCEYEVTVTATVTTDAAATANINIGQGVISVIAGESNC